MRWLFHFGEFSVSKHLLLEARQRCRGFSLLSTHRGDRQRFVVRADEKLTAFLEHRDPTIPNGWKCFEASGVEPRVLKSRARNRS